MGSSIGPVINGTAVDIDWNWGGYRAFLSMCEIQVDRDDTAGWVLLAIDTTPSNTDSHDFPAQAREMAIPRHLPRRRQPRRGME